MRGGDSDQQPDGGLGDAQAEHAAEQPQRDAFHQQLARDIAPSGSKRRTNRQLMLPAFDANQQQIGNVGAGDQKHDSNGPHQHP